MRRPTHLDFYCEEIKTKFMLKPGIVVEAPTPSSEYGAVAVNVFSLSTPESRLRAQPK